MTLLDRIRGGAVARMDDSSPADTLSEQLRAEQETNLLLQESLAELEADNAGWMPLEILNGQRQFTRHGLMQIAAAAQLNWIANPLIKRAVNVRTYYTWGQGVDITARDGQVNELVQAFLDDELNQEVLFGHEARQSKDRALQLDGNLVLACVTSPLTGRVQIRSLPWTEISRIISNPEDRAERWFYLREWTATTLDPVSGDVDTRTMKALYPDLGYRPRIRLKAMGEIPVHWDSPVLHVRTGELDGADFGCSEVYAALGWARAYKGFLEDWASLAKSLSKFAWKATTKAGRVSALRRGIDAAGGATTTTPAGSVRPTGAGQAFVADGSSELTPIPKTGAQVDADSGRPLAMMVAAGMDIPYTILMGDADMGNLATAKTLDRPTELAMQSRREMWASVLRQLIDYQINQAVKAPRGALRGTVGRDEYDREVITLTGEVDRTCEITWPSILEHDLAELVSAIVEADGTGHVPPQVICRLLLTALRVEHVDEVMDELLDAEGNFIDPGLAAEVTAGAEAVRRFRAGEDPAPDPEPTEDD